MNTKIAITAFASLSPLGNDSEKIWKKYLTDETLITFKEYGFNRYYVGAISDDVREEIETLRQSDIKYKSLDETVLMALLVSRNAVQQAGWKKGDEFGINIGSSRGATQLFEKYHKEFLETGTAATLTSPTTTLGNISSWIAHDLKSKGPNISHSITCSTALHSVLNGVAWLQAGMSDKFLVGGSEAPLTAFTLAQMHALKIYAQPTEDNFPCRAFDLDKSKNTMVLGEGAAVACLEVGAKKNALAYITGIGYATDELEHNISISDEAICFQKSMKMALKNVSIEEVDAVVMHAPGTIKGDLSEYKAIQKVFGEKLPMLTTNKWKIGHTFGSSGMLSMELALLILQHQEFIGVPFIAEPNPRKTIKNVLVNAVGFGGNAVSVLLSI